MYKERWAIESFFRWIKQNLNVPVLFGTTENAVYSQLFAALIAYVLLKFLQTECHKRNCKRLSFAGFTRQLLWGALPIERHHRIPTDTGSNSYWMILVNQHVCEYIIHVL